MKCLDAFGLVKLGIEFILDEKIEMAEKAKKIKSASGEIAKLTGTLRKTERKS